MQKFFVFVFGIAVGFVAAHKLNKTPAGQRFFASVDARKREFCRAFSEGFRDRDAQLRGGQGGKKS